MALGTRLGADDSISGAHCVMGFLAASAQTTNKIRLNFFSHYFIFNIARLVIPIYLGSTIIRLFISKNIDSPQSLGRKVKFFSPLGFDPKSTFSRKTCKLKSQLRAPKLYLNEKSLIYGQETASILFI